MGFVLLIAGVLAAAPPEPAGQLPLRLESGQEFVYRGYFVETNARAGARFSRKYDLETCVMVLNSSGSSYDVAFLTVQRPQRAASEEAISTARLEKGQVNSLGKLQLQGRRAQWPRIPLEAPPNLESEAFLERPVTVAGGQKWDAAEDGQTTLSWLVSGVARYQTHQCLLLVGVATIGEWQREDRIWLRMDSGFAIRMERKIEQRSGEFNSQMVLELQSFNPVTTTESERSARRIEINQAQRFADTLDELMLPRGEPDRRGYDTLLEMIDTHVKNRARTPYRDAIVDLRRRTVLARNGERPPEPLVIAQRSVAAGIDEGQPAPEFALADLITGDTIRLNQMRDKPVVLLMFRPTAATARFVLKYADDAAKGYAGKAYVLPLAVDGQPGVVVQLRASLKAKTPVYGGAELAKVFAGSTTPRVVILDKFGTTRLIAAGWGGEYPDIIRKELEKLTGP